MKITIALLSLTLVGASAGASFANEMPAKEALMPKCMMADQVVMVDPKSRTYVEHQASSSSNTRHEKADSEYMQNLADVKRGMKPMCKTKADATGMKMVHGSSEHQGAR